MAVLQQEQLLASDFNNLTVIRSNDASVKKYSVITMETSHRTELKEWRLTIGLALADHSVFWISPMSADRSEFDGD